ncbi:MAG: FAD-binding protein [Bdellovibrionaceae bacterium]|nr:FAD-binding protein [Pseudobdellovibrionaceae bacterium]NUM57942.1 FAD-binding protein [Pseudobdellovibrionaceae bacterium]
MSTLIADVVIVGAGPVGLMCAYLGQLCGLQMIIVDKSTGPLEVGRADALNARTLQLLKIVGLFDELYSMGKTCHTSSVWADGKFVSRQSEWWDQLEGCFHKYFLMLGQSYIEKLVDRKLKELGSAVVRSTSVDNIEIKMDSCLTTLSNGVKIKSNYVIGADGSRSFVREHFKIPFEIVRPQIVWAVIDGVVETDFKKVPEIIVFQSNTSDVAWIPREGNLDRFYVRMDTKDFTFGQALSKINRAMQPYSLKFKDIVWFSRFSVKESVAEKFSIRDRIFLAGDACHIHSVNGGQGLNTGLADAFNLIWKIHMVLKHGKLDDLLKTYEEERKPVAQSVIETSGQLVRSTKDSKTGTHALDYVRLVEKHSGNITGMGIRYGNQGLVGTRLYDFEVSNGSRTCRVYSLLDYSKFALLVFDDYEVNFNIPEFVKVIPVSSKNSPYKCKAILVRPDSYIESIMM